MAAAPSPISEAFQGAIDQLAHVHELEVTGLHEKIKGLRADLDFKSSIVSMKDAELEVLREKQAVVTQHALSRLDIGVEACMSEMYKAPRKSPSLAPISPRIHRFCQDTIPMLNGLNKDPVSLADLWKLDSAEDTAVKGVPPPESPPPLPVHVAAPSTLMTALPSMERVPDEHGFSVAFDEGPPEEHFLCTADESVAANKFTITAATRQITPRIKVTNLNENLHVSPPSNPPVHSSTVDPPDCPPVHELQRKSALKALDRTYDIADVRFSELSRASGRDSASSSMSYKSQTASTERVSYGTLSTSRSLEDHEDVRRSASSQASQESKFSEADSRPLFGNTFKKDSSNDRFQSAVELDLLASARLNNNAIMNWQRITVMMMEAASQELLQLMAPWVQSESFMLKVMRTNPDVDICTILNKEQRSTRRPRGMQRTLPVKHEEVKAESQDSKSCIIMDPQSPKRIVWALIGMILMVYDLIMIPMQAFALDNHVVMDVMAWTSQIFWTLDIFVSFVTGVYVKSELEMRFRVIVRVYATTWLPIDCIVTLPLWFLLLMNEDDDATGSQASSSLRSAKYVRLLRFLRLARLMKFDHLLSETLEFVNSSTVLLVVGMTKLIFCLALMNHINACLWFHLGNRTDGWVDVLTNKDPGYQYLSAMHWALTQFQGTSDILPGKSTIERFYGAMTVLCALIILSAFVSRLTNMMLSLQQLHSKRTHQQRVVRGYLSNHSISAHLSVRVKKYVAWKQRLERNSEYDIEICHVLPHQLIMDLLDEVRHPWLTCHAFFKIYHVEYPRVGRSICGKAMSDLSPAPGEVIFNANEACSRMYFATEGLCNYNSGPRSLRSNRTMVNFDSSQALAASSEDTRGRGWSIDVQKGDFLSEGALWTDWKHCGELIVVRDASLFVMDRDEFKQVVIMNPAAHASAVLYARRFVAVLNRFGFTHSDIIDPMVVILTAAEEDTDSECSGEGVIDPRTSTRTSRMRDSNTATTKQSQLGKHSTRKSMTMFSIRETVNRTYRSVTGKTSSKTQSRSTVKMAQQHSAKVRLPSE